MILLTSDEGVQNCGVEMRVGAAPSVEGIQVLVVTHIEDEHRFVIVKEFHPLLLGQCGDANRHCFNRVDGECGRP